MKFFHLLSTGLLGLLLAEQAASAALASHAGKTIKYKGDTYSCKCYEGDSCWPKYAVWQQLNATVGGRLQKVIPPAANCHNTFEGKPTYDAAGCEVTKAGWLTEPWHIENPISALWTFYTNNTCLPTDNPADKCTIGYLSEYVIIAKTRADIKSGVDFARKNNIRLLIRNTGHDFMGRSTAYGALAINTHSFKETTFIKKYAGPGGYTGRAVQLGAGVQTREIYKLANQQTPPQIIVGGECPTVGFAGGYIQGGGHGPMATLHGMGADQALSFDVLTAAGDIVTANAETNKDLYWALRGGGPATFGVVLSVTVKTYDDQPTAATILNINTTHTNDSALFWQGFSAFHSLSNLYVDNGMFVYYELGELRLHVQPFVAPNMNAAKLKSTLAPLFKKLDALKIPYDTSTKEFKTFFDLYIDIFEDEPGGNNVQIGGRFFAKQDIDQYADKQVEALKVASNPPGFGPSFVVGHIVWPGYGAPNVDNAINPRWRNASTFGITIVPMATDASKEDKQKALDLITNVIDKGLTDASPKGGAYVNEGNLAQPNWQTEYWGSNYPMLLKIRQKYDPDGVFYAMTTVGTEDWAELEDPPRLCRKISSAYQ